MLMLLATGLVALLLLAWGTGSRLFNSKYHNVRPLIAKVERNGQEVAKINLSTLQEPEYIHFDDGIKITVEAEPGRIRVLESECPDQICVKAGWLTKQGDIAVCMPGRTVVSI